MDGTASTWLPALWITLKLAGWTTLILLLAGMPLAWWLAHSRSRWRLPVGAVVALPMVLPPTVLGFYLLLGLAPHGPLGRLADMAGLGMFMRNVCHEHRAASNAHPHFRA